MSNNELKFNFLRYSCVLKNREFNKYIPRLNHKILFNSGIFESYHSEYSDSQINDQNCTKTIDNYINTDEIVWKEIGNFWGKIIDYDSHLSIAYHRLSMIDRFALIIRFSDAQRIMQFLPNVTCNPDKNHIFYISDIKILDNINENNTNGNYVIINAKR
ncbi:hypothetical protein [Lyticum sinuosum]|uniref:Uncharacterized protein n=1 Tax=Lyticum sinuosum TaxID=1332059 RepID=A0AAE4VJE0_9RICK|nr:hypothetical protein [Lyticum sinuosum]MDZ5760902.1 hypothetical protein [Lyticum sinuosum]